MTKMRQWTILTVVAVIVVFAAGWFLLVKPQKAKATTLRSQAATQQQANQVLLSQIARLQSEEKSLPQQQAALRKFTSQVPDNAAEPTIIRQLSAAAAGSGVDLMSMTPGVATPVLSATAAAAAAGSTSLTAPASTGQLVQLPISIGITGTFPNVEMFFQSLEKLPRALLVSGWSMCPVATPGSGGAATGSATATCTAPTIPANKSLPVGTLGGTLSATIFYAPPAGTVTSGAATTTPTVPTTTTTTPSTTTTTSPVPATSTAATPATNPAPAN
jgi:Tfp pilus assembly protein PilO